MEKRETKANKKVKREFKSKKLVIQSISLILILTLVLLFDINSPKADNNDDLVYKVYLDNEYLGRISNPGLIDDYLNAATKAYYNEYQVDTLYKPEDFRIVAEVMGENTKVDDQKVLDEFRSKAKFTVDAYTVTVKRTVMVEPDYVEEGEDDEEAGGLIEKLVIHEFNVLRKEDFNKGLEDYIKLFVSDKDYERIMNDSPLPDLTEEELILYNFYLDGDITIQKKRMNIEGLLKDSDQIVNYLLFKSDHIATKREYVVKKGDTVESIGISQEMMVDELILLNNSISSKDTILAEGMVINTSQTDPVLTVIREHYLVTREVIPHYTKVEFDESRWSYMKPWTKVAGSNGERLVKYKITSVNGVQESGAGVESSEITKEPITRVLVKGSKTSSRIGTGYYRWPTISRYISAPWGYYAPFGVRKFHYAIDIAGALNDPIYAVDNGTVEFVKFHWAGGYMIKINHNNGAASVYAHLNGWPLVSKGAVVNKGALIGRMGKSGTVTGVHLHIELYMNGTRVNPYPYLKGWR